MLTGDIQGSYAVASPRWTSSRSSSNVKVYQGPGSLTDAFIVTQPQGPAG